MSAGGFAACMTELLPICSIAGEQRQQHCSHEVLYVSGQSDAGLKARADRLMQC